MANGVREAGWRWEHSYRTLPSLFFEATLPQSVASPELVVFNISLADALGLDGDALRVSGQAGIFTGNRIPTGAMPIAQAYAGHQYGHFTGLGDGRAILFGEHLSPDGMRWDVQLKGSGRTRYSRGGDGRAALGPMLREYLISEAMAALGIPTSRSLAVATTGEAVMRDKPLPGAVLTRIAASHIRVGTFQWAAAHEDTSALRALQRYAAARHFPEVDPEDARGFFKAAVDRQIGLIVHWMRVGFIHGVMNTDNVALSGETIDYGPCAFMDRYDPNAVFSSIDRGGRYAYGNQPAITRWNLARLAESLLPLFDEERGRSVDFANEVLAGFETSYEERWLTMMRGKLGLADCEDGDELLARDMLEAMHRSDADFTNQFRALGASDASWNLEPLATWKIRWDARIARQPGTMAAAEPILRAHNPAVIPRNHRVEAALDAAVAGNFAPFHEMLAVLKSPDVAPMDQAFTEPPAPDAPPYRTFCGT